MYCKYCGSKVEEYYEYCKSCGKRLDSSYKNDDDRNFKHENIEKINQYDSKISFYSNAIPLWKLFVFNMFSLGLYSYYWYYRNWRYIREIEETDIKPGLRTLGLFVPILGWILIYQQYKYISQYAQNTLGRNFSAGGMLAIHIIFNIVSRGISYATSSSDSYFSTLWYLFIIPIYLIPMAIVQYNFNLYWKAVLPDLLIRHKLTVGEIIFTIIIGIYFIFLFITSIFLY